MAYMEEFNPDYVLILGGDHIYKWTMSNVGLPQSKQS